jgi:hypothetical protein
MSISDIVLLVVSLLIVIGISALMPWMAWKEYKYEKARNEKLRKKSIDIEL